jgi:hypothetical protein
LEVAERITERQPDSRPRGPLSDPMSELHPKHSVITTDLRDFKVYRRARREVIPLIHPPTS